MSFIKELLLENEIMFHNIIKYERKILLKEKAKIYKQKNKERFRERNKLYQIEYLEKNKERISKREKEKYQKNKKHIFKVHKEYLKNNKEKISQICKVKKECTCGLTLNQSSLSRHRKSQIHFTNICKKYNVNMSE